MGFQFAQSGNITVEIEGTEYTGSVDSPAFIDFVRTHDFADVSDANDPNQAKNVVRYCVDMVTALFGVEATKAIFDGKQVSLIDCTELIGYVFAEITAAGLGDKLTAAAAKYGKADILR